MATYSSHMVIIGKTVLLLFLMCFYPIISLLAGNKDMHESLEEFEDWPDPTTDYALAALER